MQETWAKNQTATSTGVQRAGSFTVRNVSGGLIPAYSVCQISLMTTVDDERVFELVKPTGDGIGNVLFNAAVGIPYSHPGVYTMPKATLDATYGGIPVMYSGSAPAIGDEVGTGAGSWTVMTGSSGFTVLGVDAVNLLCYVRPSGGGSVTAFDVVQAIEQGVSGQVGVKTIVLKSDVSLSPNFVQTGSRKVVSYYSL